MPTHRADPLHVVLTVHHRLVEGAGAPGATLAVAAALEARGHVVEVVGMDLLRHGRGGAVDAVRFPRAVAKLLRRRLGRGDVDVVDASTGDLAWIARSRVRASDVAVFTRSHGLEALASAARREGAARGELTLRRRYWLYHGGLRLREVARSMRAADGVLVLNAEEERFATSSLGIPEERVWRTAPLLRADLPVGPRDPARDVLILGPASWRKGGDVALRVLGTLLRSDPELCATWAGLDDPAATTAVLGSDVAARVDVEGRYGTDRLAELLAGHRVLLSCTRFEGMPVTALEALRAGLPIVGSDIPGVRELVATGAGALVPTGHVEGFLATLRRLLGDTGALDAASRVAREVARGYETDAVVDRLEDAYRTVLSVKRPMA